MACCKGKSIHAERLSWAGNTVQQERGVRNMSAWSPIFGWLDWLERFLNFDSVKPKNLLDWLVFLAIMVVFVPFVVTLAVAMKCSRWENRGRQSRTP